MSDSTRPYAILYRPAPLWAIGEGRTDLDSDIATRGGEPMRQPTSPDHHYPGDYAGQITSIEPLPEPVEITTRDGRKLSRQRKSPLARCASRTMRYVELELSDAEYQGLASRRLKIERGRPVEVTFEDRHGANAAPLIAAATSRTRAIQLEALAESPSEDGMSPEVELFAKQVEALGRLVPQNVAHSGTGLYRVKKSQTTQAAKIADITGAVLTVGGDSAGQTSIPIDFMEYGYPLAGGTGVYVYALMDSYPGIADVLDGEPVGGWYAVKAGTVFIQGAFSTAISHITTFESGGDLYVEAVLMPDGDYTDDINPAQAFAISLPGEPVTLPADAYTGGFVRNTSKSDAIKSIVSHGTGSVVLESVPSPAWEVGDNVEIVDSWPTIQAALDRVWTDQGAADFGAKQIIRVHPGVYAESLAPNISLSPAPAQGNGFILEGDPLADRSEIIIRPGAISYAFFWTKDARIRHLTFDGAAGVIAAVRVQGRVLEISDCRVDAPEAAAVMTDYGLIEDCDIRQSSASGYGVRGSSAGNIEVFRTRLTGQGSSYGVNGWAQGSLRVEACEFIGWHRGIGSQNTFSLHQLMVRNCLFAGCSIAALHCDPRGGASPVLENNIFFNCDIVCGGPTLVSAPPDITPTREGKPQVWRNNVFHGYTHFAQHLGAGAGDWVSVDWATFRTYALVAESGNMDNADPLFVDAPNGNYDLQIGSPCRWAGIGAGVLRGVNEVPFDPRTPDIGARSSGELPAAAPAEWPGDNASLAANASGSSVTLAWNTATAGEYGVMYRARLSTDGGATWSRECITTTAGMTFHGLAPRVHKYTVDVAARTIAPGQSWISAAQGSTTTAGQALGRSWPSAFPTAIMVAGSSETFENIVARTQMDTGPAQQRRRFSAAPRPLSGTLGPLTSEQLAVLDEWYHSTLQGGALSFLWKHPRTGVERVMRFIGGSPPRVTSRDPERHLVSMEMEILP